MTLRAFWRATHPEPTLTVTAVAAALAVAAGRPGSEIALVTIAVLFGQFSVGWSNDAIDAARDARNDRRDKPTVSAGLPPRALFAAAVTSLAAAAALSLSLGASGWWHVAALASAWAYNRPLKSTIASPVPFAFSFAALVVFAAPDAAGAVVAAGGALGVAAHFANVVPDLADDAATGVHGLPHRLGHWGSIAACAIAALTATALLASRLPLWWPPVAVVGAALACCAIKPLWSFRVVQAVALADVVLLIAVT